ncbi:MAG: hypothetical protein WKF66_07870 [Pedobacter sp.]
MPGKNISIIGLPASGKTTYIAALWALMLNNSPHCSLRLHSLKSGNQQYLNKISEAWLSFSEIGRTFLAKDVGEVVMNLQYKDSQEVAVLNIPDFFGELFDAHFKDREWTEDYFHLMKTSHQLILFVDPYHENNIARTIMDERQILEQYGDLEDVMEESAKQKQRGKEENKESGKVDTKESKSPLANAKIYQHINSSNQVKLVEILQYLLFSLSRAEPSKVAIVVSKWDKVMENFPNKRPDEVVKSNLPLLYQFLYCNTSDLIFKFFGVSAQGVDYDNTDGLDEFVKMLPEDRVNIFDGANYSKDIATPITWLIE